MKFRTTIRKKAASTAIALLLAVGATMAGPSGARAGADPFLGEIMLFAGTFCPVGYLECNGALVPIAQNSALYAILGTTYGGDGQTNFALPDLRGRVPVGNGTGPNLSPRTLGQPGGTENETLTIFQMPQHSHSITISLPASSTAATKGTPENNIPAVPERSVAAYTDASADKAMRSPTATVGFAGNNLPHNNMPPYLTLRYCIATQGIFPTRD